MDRDGCPPLSVSQESESEPEAVLVRTDSARLSTVRSMPSHPLGDGSWVTYGPCGFDCGAAGQGHPLGWVPWGCSGHGSTRFQSSRVRCDVSPTPPKECGKKDGPSEEGHPQWKSVAVSPMASPLKAGDPKQNVLMDLIALSHWHRMASHTDPSQHLAEHP